MEFPQVLTSIIILRLHTARTVTNYSDVCHAHTIILKKCNSSFRANTWGSIQSPLKICLQPEIRATIISSYISFTLGNNNRRGIMALCIFYPTNARVLICCSIKYNLHRSGYNHTNIHMWLKIIIIACL